MAKLKHPNRNIARYVSLEKFESKSKYFGKNPLFFFKDD